MPVYDMSDRLRVFAKLDYSKLSDEFIQKVEAEEGRADYVDMDIARDFPFTQEIQENRIGAALVDEEGNILAEYPGDEGFLKALAARAGAKIDFTFNLAEGGPIEVDEDLSGVDDNFVAPDFDAAAEAAKAQALAVFLKS